MNGSMDADDRKLFAEAIAAAASSGADLDLALGGLGWRDALAEYPADAVSILFEAQGRSRATSSALDWVLLDAASAEADSVVVNGLALHGITHAKQVLVLGSGVVPAGDLEFRPVHGMDPSLGLHAVIGTSAGAPEPEVLAAGQRALAHELVGLARTMLSLAREHALTREQFGSPIARFQALRHKMAESLVAIEAADAAAAAAWEAPGPLSASIAKALAGQAARTTAKHAQQILAGMGFTTEHSFHLYFKRALVLDHLLGSSKQLTEDFGRQLLASRELPPMLPL